MTGTVDFGIFGFAAATLGGGRGERGCRHRIACNRAAWRSSPEKGSGINTIEGLEGQEGRGPAGLGQEV